MSYSCFDYYYLNWVLPRGTTTMGQPLHIKDGGTVASEWLRDYIWSHQIDSHLANGE